MLLVLFKVGSRVRSTASLDDKTAFQPRILRRGVLLTKGQKTLTQTSVWRFHPLGSRSHGIFHPLRTSVYAHYA
jgi:hypothetical protein